MTIRSKLSIAMLAMFCMLVLVAWTVNHFVTTISNHALAHARMRELSVLTDDIRAEIFYQVAVAHGLDRLRTNEDWWPDDVLQDVRVRVSLAASDDEKRGWRRVEDGIRHIAHMRADDPAMVDLVREADQQLRKLRREYNRRLADSVAVAAEASFMAQLVVVAAALVLAAVFAMIPLLLRDWLVRPLDILNEAADEIGRGNLDHRVSPKGKHELAKLGRRIDAMAEQLGDHQKQLVEAREMAAIGELCTNVAHGLRNPLAGMRAAAQLASRRVDDKEYLRSTMNDILPEIDRMDQRITQLFEFSRILRLDKQPATFAEIIDDAQAEARGVVKSKGITVETTDESRGTTWSVDRQKFAAAIGEIITNSAHHSESGSSIEVAGKLADRTNGTSQILRISIVDHGAGIHANGLKRLFDLFYTTRPNGTGMGLPLAQRIIAQHGGAIEVSSTLGEGTRVDVTLSAAHREGMR